MLNRRNHKNNYVLLVLELFSKLEMVINDISLSNYCWLSELSDHQVQLWNCPLAHLHAIVERTAHNVWMATDAVCGVKQLRCVKLV